MDKLHPLFNSFTDHFLGTVNAPIEIMEYGDFECTHCGTLYSVVKFLQEIFGDKLR